MKTAPIVLRFSAKHRKKKGSKHENIRIVKIWLWLANWLQPPFTAQHRLQQAVATKQCTHRRFQYTYTSLSRSIRNSYFFRKYLTAYRPNDKNTIYFFCIMQFFTGVFCLVCSFFLVYRVFTDILLSKPLKNGVPYKMYLDLFSRSIRNGYFSGNISDRVGLISF